MGILTRPLLTPQERFDLEDFNLQLSALRTDSHFYTGSFLAPTSYILQGFSISQTYLGQTTAQVSLTNATLINPNNSGDVSWWTAPTTPTPITLPTGVGGLQPGRNYVELIINAVDGTPLQRAFWDPSANSGAGVEFTQEVNTVTELFANAQVNQTGFTVGNPNLIALSIIDVNGSGNITGIRDKRNLFFRLGSNSNINSTFSWGTQSEPTTTLTFTTNSSSSYVSGETVTFGSGATAVVVVGGTNNIQVFNFSTDSFLPGDLITGETSGSTAILQNYYESFVGADKDIHSYRDMFTALETELKRVKGTAYWYQIGPVVSLGSLLNYINIVKTPLTSGARFSWTGTSFIITDNATSGQTSADALAALRIPGQSSNIYLARQDGTGGTAALGLPAGNILWVQLPTLGSSITYSGSGSSADNYQVTPVASFVPTDSNFILAYNEGGTVVIPGMGELKAGETIDVSGETSIELLAYIGAASETSTNPQYTTTPNTNLSNQFTTSDSLTQAISINAANINDIADALISPYAEELSVISGSPANSNQVMGPISATTDLTLPLDSRNSEAVKNYIVGQGGLQVFLNGVQLVVGEDYNEVGTSGSLSNQIEILYALVVGDELDFRIMIPQFFGTAANNQPFFVNYISGQNGNTIPTGALYNVGTNRLQLYRDGINELKSLSFGAAIDQYQEETANSLSLVQAANPSEVFTIVNYPAPSPNVVISTGFSSTTIPTGLTYTIGNGTLQVYRNGLLLSTNGSAPSDLQYTEASTTTVTLSLAATVTDVFRFLDLATTPTFRVSTIGVTGTVITIPGSHSYTIGNKHLLVFRNGVLMVNSVIIDQPINQYQESSTTTITLQVAAVSTDLFEFIYV